MGSAVNVALPTIGEEFALTAVQLNLLALSFFLASAVFMFPFGRVADIYGRKKMILVGIVVYTIFSVLCGFSYNIYVLIIARFFQGTSGAMIAVNTLAILTSVYTAGERGKMLGLNVAITYTGLSIGPFLGGFLVTTFGWRSIFFSVVPLELYMIWLLLGLKQEWIEAKNESFDFIGSVIYGIGITGIICGLSLIRTYAGIAVMAIGILSIFAFYIYETKTKMPLMDIGLFKRNKILTFSSLAAMINYSSTSAVGYLISLYLQYYKGYNPQMAGMILMAQPVIQAIFSPIAGKLSDKIEPQKVASLGMAVITGGLFYLSFINEQTNIISIVIVLVFLGFGFALFSSPNTNAVMNSVDKKLYGTTSGIIGAARSVGMALSMGISALVFSIYVGKVQLSAGYHPNFIISIRVTFIILTILCFIGIFASLARGKSKNILED